MVVAIDDVFVVPVPTIMKADGLFQAADNSSIAADARDDVAHQLADASSGWNAVAVGSSGRPGLALKAASEQDAVNGAWQLHQARQQLPCDRDRPVRGWAKLAREFRKALRHRPINLPPERHDEIGDAVEPLPSPGIKFRRLAVA